MRWLVLIASALMPCGGADPADALWARFQEKVRQDLTQIVNYTCLETIRRAAREPKGNTLQPLDTVRVEVSRVDGKELFAWPGARQFSDASLASFVAGGSTSTGVFETTARQVFASGAAEVKYQGEHRMDGRTAVRYWFRLPAARGYRVQIPGASEMVAMDGSFWFDANSLDLIRIESHGVDIPAVLKLGDITMSISYARVLVAGGSVLLPRRAAVELAGLDGSLDRNDMEFSQCHAYQTEATIRFDAPPAADPEVPRVQPHAVRLAAGLMVGVVLQTAIDFRTSAVGDPVRATVRADVRRDGNVVLPEGATINGRIRLLQRRSSYGAPYDVAGLELLDVEWPGAQADFYGELVDADARRGITPGYAVRGRATFIMRGRNTRIDPGLGLLWRILDRPSQSAQ